MPLYSNESPTSEQVVDTLRLSDAEWRQIVDEIDRESARFYEVSDHRRHERVSYRNAAYLLVSIKSQDGRVQRFRVRTHDLSESGMGFLHGTFIYPGSQVTVVLNHHTQGAVYIEGLVRRCEHYKRHVHRIGVEFNRHIEPELFLLAG